MENRIYNITVLLKTFNKHFTTVQSNNSDLAVKSALSNLPKDVKFSDILKVEVREI